MDNFKGQVRSKSLCQIRLSGNPKKKPQLSINPNPSGEHTWFNNIELTSSNRLNLIRIFADCLLNTTGTRTLN